MRFTSYTSPAPTFCCWGSDPTRCCVNYHSSSSAPGPAILRAGDQQYPFPMDRSDLYSAEIFPHPSDVFSLLPPPNLFVPRASCIAAEKRQDGIGFAFCPASARILHERDTLPASRPNILPAGLRKRKWHRRVILPSTSMPETETTLFQEPITHQLHQGPL